MPFRSRWEVDIPSCSFPTWLFGPASAPIRGSAPIFIDANRPQTHFLTLDTYRQWSQRVAAGLRAAGLQPGGRVLLCSKNDIYYPIIFMGIVLAGGIFTGANPNMVPRELAHQLRDSGATFLICHEDSLSVGIQAANSVGISNEGIFVFDGEITPIQPAVSGCRHWSALVSSPEVGEAFHWEEFDSKKDQRTMCLNYSSGTTGVPKGVEITHLNYIANCIQFVYTAQLDPAQAINNGKVRELCFLPLYHAMAQTIFLAVAPKKGAPTWIMPKYDFESLLQNIEQFKITNLVLVPPIVISMAKSPLSKNYNLSSVERVMVGAAPLRRDICEVFEALFLPKQVNVKQGWGMTEATCSVLAWHPNESSLSFSVGEPSANCEIKIVDEEDETHEITTCDTKGELWVRAPNVMKGYWRNPKATAETLTPDGWLKTGDIGYVDKEGKFYIVDRKKELIKVRGNQVAPAELEALLLDHPAISDAAVIGVEQNGDEVPRAYVVATKQVSEKDIVDWMKGRVSKTKYLSGGVRFIEAIPRNASGKILRRQIKEQARLEDSQPVQSRL